VTFSVMCTVALHRSCPLPIHYFLQYPVISVSNSQARCTKTISYHISRRMMSGQLRSSWLREFHSACQCQIRHPLPNILLDSCSKEKTKWAGPDLSFSILPRQTTDVNHIWELIDWNRRFNCSVPKIYSSPRQNLAFITLHHKLISGLENIDFRCIRINPH
jgi:hypothetical protein